MRTLITLIALTTSVVSMDDEEFINFGETLKSKYGLQTCGGSGTGYHLRESDFRGYEPDFRIWYKRPYDYGHKQIGPYKQLGIRFSGKRDTNNQSALDDFQKFIKGFHNFHISSVGYESWIVCFTNEPEKFDASTRSLEIIWQNNLIPTGLYDFFLDELGIEDPCLNNIPSFIRKIVPNLPENPTFTNFKETMDKNLSEIRSPSTREKLCHKINDEIKTNCFGLSLDLDPIPELPVPDDSFLDYLMSDYYMDAIRPHNLSLLIRRIKFVCPKDATDETLGVRTLKELELIPSDLKREKMACRLIEALSSNAPKPSYLIGLCDWILPKLNKEGSWYKEILRIKGDLIFNSESKMDIKDRYAPMIESTLHSKDIETQNTFIKYFINNGDRGEELSKDLMNLDLTFESFMRLLDHIRKQNISLKEKK